MRISIRYAFSATEAPERWASRSPRPRPGSGTPPPRERPVRTERSVAGSFAGPAPATAVPSLANATHCRRPDPGAASGQCCAQGPAIRGGLSVSGFDEGALMSRLLPGSQGPGGYRGSAWRCWRSGTNLSPACGLRGGEASVSLRASRPHRVVVRQAVPIHTKDVHGLQRDGHSQEALEGRLPITGGIGVG